ncbi:hypothetical protein [Streptomyces buecherae]|nr:hypothetical protein [Streptomyces buecherae]
MCRHMVLPQVAAAVVSYLPTAIEYVDDVDSLCPPRASPSESRN